MWPKDYIQGNRRGKEANKLERKALSDPFMQDALDGFDAVAGDHVEIIKQLEKKYTNTAATPQSGRKVFLYRSIAASVLLVIGFGAYLFLERDKRDIPVVAEVRLIEEIEKENIISSDSLELPPEPVKESQQMMLAEAKVVKKKTQAPVPAVPDEIVSNIFAEESVVAEIADSNHLSIIQSKPLAAVEIAAKPEDKEFIKQLIRGKIIDETGEPIAGAVIAEKGTNTGTVSGIDGTFALQLSANDSSTLTTSFIGYESQEIKASDIDQTIILKPSDLALNEVVVVGHASRREKETSASVYAAGTQKVRKDNSNTFGEKEFKLFCEQRADKNVCEREDASVKVSFFINETGKPTQIEYKHFSCEGAKKEMENLLTASPVWTKTNRKVSMTIKW